MNSRGSDYLSFCQFLSAMISKTVRCDVNFFPLTLLLASQYVKYRLSPPPTQPLCVYAFEQLSSVEKNAKDKHRGCLKTTGRGRYMSSGHNGLLWAALSSTSTQGLPSQHHHNGKFV